MAEFSLQLGAAMRERSVVINGQELVDDVHQLQVNMTPTGTTLIVELHGDSKVEGEGVVYVQSGKPRRGAIAFVSQLNTAALEEAALEAQSWSSEGILPTMIKLLMEAALEFESDTDPEVRGDASGGPNPDHP